MKSLILDRDPSKGVGLLSESSFFPLVAMSSSESDSGSGIGSVFGSGSVIVENRFKSEAVAWLVLSGPKGFGSCRSRRSLSSSENPSMTSANG